MRSAKSYAAHLTGIYAALKDGGAAETNRAVQQWLNGRQNFLRPGDPAPRQRGALTILHIHGAVDPEEVRSPGTRVGCHYVGGLA